MSLKNPTCAEIAELVQEAHRPCRCDGGCTNCGACSAERKLDMYIRSGLVIRTPAARAFTDPTYTLKTPEVHGATSGRFSSAHPNQANTPKALRHIKRTEDYNGNVDGCIADCPACKDEFGSDACVRPSHRLKPKWILHGNYAHVFDAPCAVCNPPNELLRYRALLEACYCPKPTASGYKPLCMNCREAATLVTKILERMNIS